MGVASGKKWGSANLQPAAEKTSHLRVNYIVFSLIHAFHNCSFFYFYFPSFLAEIGNIFFLQKRLPLLTRGDVRGAYVAHTYAFCEPYMQKGEATTEFLAHW